MNTFGNLASGPSIVGGQHANLNRLVTDSPVDPSTSAASDTRYTPSATIIKGPYGDAYGPPKLSTQLTFSEPYTTGGIAQTLASNLTIAPLQKNSLRLGFHATTPILNATEQLNSGVLHLPKLASLGEDYQQDIRQYAQLSTPDENRHYQAMDPTGFVDKKSEDLASINLQLKTRDGDTINFSLTSYKGYGRGDDERPASFSGIRVSFEIEGDLTPKELKQLEAFSQTIQQASSRYFNSGQLDMAELDLSALSQFSDIELSFLNNGDGSGDRHLKMRYHDDHETRAIEVSLNGHTSNISIDKTSLGMDVSAQQSQQALEQYLILLKDNASEARAQPAAADLMLSMFNLGFANLQDEAKAALSQAPIDVAAASAEQPIKNGLVGLPDFTFSFEARTEMPNAKHQPLEHVGFSVNLSLKSRVNEDVGSNTESISQTQKSHLSAAYYAPLDTWDNVDFKYQNYQYIQLQRSSEQVTNLITQDNELILAAATEEGTFHKTTQVYEMGQLEDENTEHAEHAQISHFTELAKQESEQQTMALLNLVMIDPQQKH
ncbi:MAG: hypothetical protein RPR40_04810 [Bermanella sp.]